MKPELPHSCQLPIVLPPVTDELLWIHRHAVFYGVPPLVMLRHCLVDVTSLRAIDLRLTDEQAFRLAHVFRTEASDIHRMSLSNISPKCRLLIAVKPMQFCANCAKASEIRMSPSLHDEVTYADGASAGRGT
jgi:hypothetical protein